MKRSDVKQIDENTELRHLPPGVIMEICNLLDDRRWKQVMAEIRRDVSNPNSEPKYSAEHIQLVETYACNHKKSPMEILIYEWGTSGKARPTLNALCEVLIRLELFRVVNFIRVEVLKKSPIKSCETDFSKMNIMQSNESRNVTQIPFSVLSEITSFWDEQPFSRHNHTGHKLGCGAFGAVYYGKMFDGTEVAVKKLKDDTAALFGQFQAEITTLSCYRHKNLLPLLGFSQDTCNYCLVYEFMPNGSLQSCLEKSALSPFSWRQRLIIAVGTCEGINYLHTARSVPLIHRDVKTANILLDENMEAKLGDFGLVRTSPADSRATSTIFGTSAYMAPEAFRGDVSVKTDVFSVGVVLLELLTALSPYDESRNGADLVTYVEESADGDIEPLLDPNADWEIAIAEAVFDIAQLCIAEKKRRPLMATVLDSLQQVLEGVSRA